MNRNEEHWPMEIAISGAAAALADVRGTMTRSWTT